MKQFYQSFDLISETDIPDCSSKALYLRHRETGLEVFHLLNDDDENTFAFAFRTPAVDATGAAHIVEHSVFCGSEKFPLKEPFVNLMNQSLNTYLNALTYPDKTVYPAASVNRADYFNLMDVYGDAVFFPLLSRETFMQEGHRLEIDGKGVRSVQGVVYNEMKGNYSSFDSVAEDAIVHALQRGTVYEKDSGGDPLVIPSLTYEQFTAFHKKYYSPSNCLVFLHGNIKTEDQLDFLQEKLIDRLEKKYPHIVTPSSCNSYGTCTQRNYTDGETAADFSEPCTVSVKGPDSGISGEYVTVNWRMGKCDTLDDVMETLFVAQILAGHDGSPVSCALLSSNLGDGLLIDAENMFRTQMITFGLSGVQKGNEQAVEAVVLQTLRHVVKNGIDKNDVAAAVLAVDMTNREVVRLHGPFSLELMNRALNGWNYGTAPEKMLGYRAAFETVKAKLNNDPQYVNKLVEKFFIENKNRATVIVSPDSSYLAERNRREQEMTSQLASGVDGTVVKRAMAALDEYQRRTETEKEAACIPHVRPADLSPERPPIITDVQLIDGTDGSKVPVFTNTEPTNGIIYLDVGFPADVLPPDAYEYLPLFTHCVLDSGWNGKSWAECASLAGLCTGDMTAAAMTQSVSTMPGARDCLDELRGLHCTGRDWILFSTKMTAEKAKDACNLLAEAFTTVSFADADRIRLLASELKNSAFQAVLPAGSRFAVSRAECAVNRTEAVREIWSGISQLFSIKRIAEEPADELCRRFAGYMEKIRRGGALIHVTADAPSLGCISRLLPSFAKNAGLHALSERTQSNDDAFFKRTALPGTDGMTGDEWCEIDTQVGFAASAFACPGETVSQLAADIVLAHWLTSNALWTGIRTTGGAYGAYADVEIIDDVFSFSTYRDPSPDRSLDVFSRCFSDIRKSSIDDAAVERAVTGCYGEIIQPLSPVSRGFIGLKRRLYGTDSADLFNFRKAILAVTAADVRDAADRMYAYSVGRRNAVISHKCVKKTGIIVQLPV